MRRLKPPTTGRLTGTVTDQQGGVIPRALILAKNDQTGAEFRATANEVGVWVIPSVPSGSYTVSVNAQAFRTAIFKEIKVDTGATVTVDATLQIGLADTVVVTASKFEEEVVNAPATATVISEQTIQTFADSELGRSAARRARDECHADIGAPFRGHQPRRQRSYAKRSARAD